MIVPRTLFAKLLLLFLGVGALMTGVFIFVMRVNWRPRGRCSIGAQKARQLATQGMYARMRRPQYTGARLPAAVTALLTLVMFPVLVTMYVRLRDLRGAAGGERIRPGVAGLCGAHTALPAAIRRLRHEPATPERA